MTGEHLWLTVIGTKLCTRPLKKKPQKNLGSCDVSSLNILHDDLFIHNGSDENIKSCHTFDNHSSHSVSVSLLTLRVTVTVPEKEIEMSRILHEDFLHSAGLQVAG